MINLKFLKKDLSRAQISILLRVIGPYKKPEAGKELLYFFDYRSRAALVRRGLANEDNTLTQSGVDAAIALWEDAYNQDYHLALETATKKIALGELKKARFDRTEKQLAIARPGYEASTIGRASELEINIEQMLTLEEFSQMIEDLERDQQSHFDF